MLHEINWPHGYLPGYTDNFASNEVIVRNLTAKEVFDTLIDASLWESYYKNSSDVEFDNTGVWPGMAGPKGMQTTASMSSMPG